VDELVIRMRMAHEILHEQQWQLRIEDSDDSPLHKVGDWVWMTSHAGGVGRWLGYSQSLWVLTA